MYELIIFVYRPKQCAAMTEPTVLVHVLRKAELSGQFFYLVALQCLWQQNCEVLST